MAHDAGRAARAREPVQSVANRNRRGIQVRKLSDHGAGVRVLDEETHEAKTVVVVAFVRWKEEIARERRDRRNDRIRDHDCAALRDLQPLVDVAAGILPADDVFRRRKESPEPEEHERDWNERGETRPRRRGAKSQPAPADDRRCNRHQHVRQQEPLEAVAIDRGQQENHRQRNRGAHHDGPEDALFSLQRRPPLAIHPGQPEQRCPRKPADDDQLENREQQRLW